MADITFLQDVSYGPHERNVVDIFIPDVVKNSRGLILFIHGGGWSNGDKTSHHNDARYFSNLGYITASMNYRFVSTDIDVFDELDDVTSALAKLKSVCGDYGYDLENVILSGVSAGAHLSLMYSYTRLSEAPLMPVATCPYCPPVDCAAPDFLIGLSGEFEDWKYEVLSLCCGCTVTKATLLDVPQQEALKRMSPVSYLKPDCVPTAIFYGGHDELIPIRQTENFIDMMREYGVPGDVVFYENSNHALDKDPDASQQAWDVIEKYAEMYL